ncbi:MAG: hypothetical protein LLG04_16860 [Parachlamydia sp.]|nr:hypothetical protein [Parachlamydia sp.]
MAHTFWESLETGKPYIGPKHPPGPAPKKQDDTVKKVSETSLERMTGPVGQPEAPRKPKKPHPKG